MSARAGTAWPRMLALMEKREEGDDALLRLARLRLEQVGMGAEIHAGSLGQLAKLLVFRPRGGEVVVHLPRDLDVLTSQGRERIISMAAAGQSDVMALVVHDQAEVAASFEVYLEALQKLNQAISHLARPPRVCLEYAAGLEPARFVALLNAASPLRHIGACVDVGHLGIAAARRAFEKRHPGRDVCSITPTDAELPSLIDDVQDAVAQGREVACKLTADVVAIGKGLHMHLHDAHPLSTLSPWGVSDHLSFLETMVLPFEYQGAWSAETMFGPAGLSQIVDAALGEGSVGVSFTLEIHATEGRRPLRDAERLFSHWSDCTNAEKMNDWLSVLQNNRHLLCAACARSGYPLPGSKETHSSRHSEHFRTP